MRPDIRHYLQFLQLAGRYLVWDSGMPSSVLDLETGGAFDVQGSLAGSEEMIVKEEPVGPAPKGEFVASRVSSISLSAATAIPSCRR